jgi:hypothetical protein
LIIDKEYKKARSLLNEKKQIAGHFYFDESERITALEGRLDALYPNVTEQIRKAIQANRGTLENLIEEGYRYNLRIEVKDGEIVIESSMTLSSRALQILDKIWRSFLSSGFRDERFEFPDISRLFNAKTVHIRFDAAQSSAAQLSYQDIFRVWAKDLPLSQANGEPATFFIDGHSASGKSSMFAQGFKQFLQGQGRPAIIVPTDDLYSSYMVRNVKFLSMFLLAPALSDPLKMRYLNRLSSNKMKWREFLDGIRASERLPSNGVIIIEGKWTRNIFPEFRPTRSAMVHIAPSLQRRRLVTQNSRNGRLSLLARARVRFSMSRHFRHFSDIGLEQYDYLVEIQDDGTDNGTMDMSEPHKGRAASRTDDKAMPANGGIDFNSSDFAMTIKRNGRGLPLPISQQDMAQLSRIGGFVPRILEIRSASNFPFLNQAQHAAE